jgi:hypothetical protein
MKMRVTRPFLLGGIRQEIDTEVDIESRADAAMLQNVGKAVPVDSVPKRGPMTTESSALVAGPKATSKDSKGQKNE